VATPESVRPASPPEVAALTPDWYDPPHESTTEDFSSAGREQPATPEDLGTPPRVTVEPVPEEQPAPTLDDWGDVSLDELLGFMPRAYHSTRTTRTVSLYLLVVEETTQTTSTTEQV
jgi:hypothetical protein